uniref:Uncharacterized protein n=1 Tax=Timema bartmani TaxID=61472 RepID=A0A7R9I809_9NEOP|nr:unnamed protein product [Timema bartmani]
MKCTRICAEKAWKTIW